MEEQSRLDRFSALSDGIFAVIITIMVLALRPPARNDLHTLLGLWPDFISYMVSYAFIAVVWLNHQHVFKYAEHLTGTLAWSNFANLFAISLIPFTTAWLASSRVAPLPMTVYAAVFLAVELTYIALMRESFRQRAAAGKSARGSHRIQWIRAWIMVAVFAFAAIPFAVPPLVRMAFMAMFLVFHARPDPLAGREI